MKYLDRILVLWAVICLVSPGWTCGPGRSSARPGTRRKLTDLAVKQYMPNVSEFTLGASGPAEGKIQRGDEKFNELTPNHNADIIFKDEEGTGADRLMTQRCKDKLNSLAILVMHRWEGIKVRVTEAWDEDGYHAADSLHYEGRAVDITTSDRDRNKYGMLARLAVEAGFDWVYYESRSHVHCSVRSEHSKGGGRGGCFPASSTVTLENGATRSMDQIQLGDRVLTVNEAGQTVYSDVIMMLDKKSDRRQSYHVIETEDYGYRLTVSRGHLVYASNFNWTFDASVKPVYAGDLQVGQYLYVAENQGATLRPVKITRISTMEDQGVFAPLTTEGTIVVDNVVTSCYAMVNHNLAHFAFAPVRFLKQISTNLWSAMAAMQTDGIHWYPHLLYSIAGQFLSDSLVYEGGILV
ncbi:sonic hedgehog protein-like [Glandiceps talaboti]